MNTHEFLMDAVLVENAEVAILDAHPIADGGENRFRLGQFRTERWLALTLHEKDILRCLSHSSLTINQL
jgi:hypothetical protein